MKTFALALASLVTLSGAALASDSITINQQSSGGIFSRNSATVNSAGRGSQNVFIAQDGARSQSATANVRSGRGDAVGTILQTGGVNNQARMNLTAPRGTADGVLVQNGSRSNTANVNLRGGAGSVFQGAQTAAGRNTFTGTFRGPTANVDVMQLGARINQANVTRR